ncbi:drug resistance transporter, EmrB/QacA subfamily [Lobosporangium transversale]|uniref:Drug resistance transporter, EmrB/QacA subfamily n=1 Tax=Lobosporangium transversale TaxID=64571 RepID=A0A1Y2H2B7_9FUNG|nr:drug resistance transporter, EmrB/QacA subfamily [Lobosporangium transversale]ORZ27853.1 drug resistance transporter, EmrB/QacA subfamily [Lobosporangium transversale]|eukprot:XP_021885556.1 drug resistance transporter, EmrB/QacA subfamily [Lobosporangium transversale]
MLHLKKKKKKKKRTLPLKTTPGLSLWPLRLAMASFLASLDGTIIATALPRITSDFRAQSEMAWVATAYLLTFNAFQPLYGKFSDIFGRKASILFATVTFMIGSGGAGGANSMTMLIVFRAIQGLGGSGLLSIVLIIISDIFPLEERPKYQSIIWSVFGISSVIGPLLGGVFVQQTTWRWCFLINLPLGVVTVAAVVLFLKLPFKAQRLREQLARIDYLGTLLIIVAVICLLLPITWGGTTYDWDSAVIIVLFCVAVILIAILLWIESRATEAIIPPRLFRNKTVSVLFAVNFLTGMSFLGIIFYAPLYFQVVKGVSATRSGLHLLPMVLGLVVASIGSGAMLNKVGDYRVFIWIGTILMSIGIGLCMLLDADSNMGEQIGFLLVAGCGIGLILQTCMLAAQAAVEKRDMAVVTAMCGFFNSIGGGIGIAICSALFNNHLKDSFKKYPVEILQVINEYHITEAITAVQLLPPEVKGLVMKACVESFQFIYKCLTPIACAAFIMSLFVRKLRMLDPSEIIMGAA